MNKNIRKYGKMPKKGENEVLSYLLEARYKRQSLQRSKASKEFEEVLPPRSKRYLKGMLSRCCYVVPDQRSFGQDTDICGQHENYHSDQLGLKDLDAIAKLQNTCGSSCSKVEHASQYLDPTNYMDVDCESWPNEKLGEKLRRDEETLTQYHNLPKTYRISDNPRVKVIANKFTKYKKNDIEIRKLVERVVCVEYDIFDDSLKTGDTKPIQKMRAFFVIKPNNDEKDLLTETPSTIKNKFNISPDELQNLNQKEIEIADGSIENQSYLEDLRKVLRRKQNSAKKCKINSQTLYEIAKRELLESKTVFDLENLDKDQMDEVEKMILKNCKSSVHGITRRTVNILPNTSDSSTESSSENTISQTLVTELLRVDSHQ